mmetsp:Transcript_22480/g.34239  ORF Transcript_22480/g.34239 Transcript_22480/m.34239 type:complete len:163 (-) Transcript_22480:74-562(-)
MDIAPFARIPKRNIRSNLRVLKVTCNIIITSARTKEAAEGSTASDGDAKEDSEWFWGRPSECNGHLWGKGYQSSDMCRGIDNFNDDYQDPKIANSHGLSLGGIQIWKHEGGISIFRNDDGLLYCCPGDASSRGDCEYVRVFPAVSDYGYVEYHPSGRICWYS